MDVHAYAPTKWPIDLTFTYVMFRDPLASNQEIRDDLEKAHQSGQYAEIATDVSGNSSPCKFQTGWRPT